MTTLRNRSHVAPIMGMSAPPAVVEISDGAERTDRADPRPDLGVVREHREVASIAHHLHQHHPDVPLPEITAMVEHELAELAQSRVQGFRMTLAERAVRRRLASHPDRAGT